MLNKSRFQDMWSSGWTSREAAKKAWYMNNAWKLIIRSAVIMLKVIVTFIAWFSSLKALDRDFETTSFPFQNSFIEPEFVTELTCIVSTVSTVVSWVLKKKKCDRACKCSFRELLKILTLLFHRRLTQNYGSDFTLYNNNHSHYRQN